MNRQYFFKEKQFWDDKGLLDYCSLSVHDQNRISEWINWHGKGIVLDIGGGAGMASRLLASFPETKCVCADISLPMLKHASIPAVQADALSLPFRENSFDMVIAAAFFHHLPGREDQLLKEIYRVLCPGGKLIGYDPNGHCFQNRLFMTNSLLRLKKFSPDELPIIPEKLGAHVVKSGLFNYKFIYFSFVNKNMSFFEFIQRYIISQISFGKIKPFLDRWFFWNAIKYNE
jgi:ubiquinone/menaquinone biosynthesis C-methylase UbiE